MADCNYKCSHCLVERKFWYCKKCQEVGRRVLIARSMSRVLPATLHMAEASQVFNFRTTRKEFIDSDRGFNADSLHSFFCKRCNTCLGYRHTKNHCPTQKASLVKDLRTREIKTFRKRKYCTTDHQVVYTLCFSDNLMWLTHGECSFRCAKFLDMIRDLDLTVTIRSPGFNDVHDDDVLASLEALFSDCGEIQSLSITPGPLRCAYVEFKDHISFLSALERDGNTLLGSVLRVESASQPTED